MDRQFDDFNRFVMSDYTKSRPFASFLPGIAGPTGIPLWAFYVNRGQAITSFGVADKDHPIMEFQPANKAYQATPYTGFRTFIKLRKNEATYFYEPFAPWSQKATRKMLIGLNELELQEYCPAQQLQTNILYFTLPGEVFRGSRPLCRPQKLRGPISPHRNSGWNARSDPLWGQQFPTKGNRQNHRGLDGSLQSRKKYSFLPGQGQHRR